MRAAPPKRLLAASASTAAVIGTVHAFPAVSAVGPLRRALAPRLCGDGSAGGVALTFDDGPDPASTPAFLRSLERLGWKATFFMLGSMAQAAPGLAKEIVAAGHEVALHGSEHRNHLARSPSWVLNDLGKGYAQVSEASGCQPMWHRPPYGVVSGATVLAARRLGTPIVLWGAWGRDWRAKATSQTVLADLRRTMAGGSTLLLHDSDCTSAPGAWRSALGVLAPLAEHLEQQNLAVKTLSAHMDQGSDDDRNEK